MSFDVIYLLEWNAMSGKVWQKFKMFRKNQLPPSSGSKFEAVSFS
jgi:hypothetical protein